MTTSNVEQPEVSNLFKALELQVPLRATNDEALSIGPATEVPIPHNNPTPEDPDSYASYGLYMALNGYMKMPSPAALKEFKDYQHELFTQLVMRFFQYRADLKQRLWINAFLACQNKPTKILVDMRILFGLMVKEYRGVLPTDFIGTKFYKSTWPDLRRYVTNYGMPPTKAELRYRPSGAHEKIDQSHAKTAEGEERALELLENPDAVIKIFKQSVRVDKETKCWVWDGATQKAPATFDSGGPRQKPIFYPGRLMTPRPAQDPRRFSFMYMRKGHTYEELTKHARIKQKHTCLTNCVNPAHMEA